MTTDKDVEIAALKARLEALESAPPPAAPAAPPVKGNAGGIGCAIAGILGAVVLVAFCSQQPATSPTTAIETPSASSWAPPEGYSLHTTARGQSLGTKWFTPSRADCRGSGVTCFGLNVVSETSCPRSLYASVSLFNKAGENIGWTNDTAQGVQGGEPVRLVFDTYTANVESARIAELHCY